MLLSGASAPAGKSPRGLPGGRRLLSSSEGFRTRHREQLQRARRCLEQAGPARDTSPGSAQPLPSRTRRPGATSSADRGKPAGSPAPGVYELNFLNFKLNIYPYIYKCCISAYISSFTMFNSIFFFFSVFLDSSLVLTPASSPLPGNPY